MGDFAMRVRRNQISGPNHRGFKRQDWKAAEADTTLDDEDRRVIVSGLFFDELLSFLRKEKRLAGIPLLPTATIRILIAIATLNLHSIHAHGKQPKPEPGERSEFSVPATIAKMIEVQNGQTFAPDELLTGLGDGLKHMLAELQLPANLSNQNTEYAATTDDIDNINLEFNKAILYQCAVEYWLDCLGNGYGLTKHEKGAGLVPLDTAQEIARCVSTYRRLNIGLQEVSMFSELWSHKFSQSTKKKLCEIRLISRVYGLDRIERIDVGLSKAAMDAASLGIASKVLIEQGYYRDLLDDPLPGFNNITIRQIISGWRLLQSLSIAIFDGLRPPDTFDVRALLHFAPRIPKRVLLATFTKALGVDGPQASKLIDVFCFDAQKTKDVWLHPLVACEDDYCLVIPCIHSVHLLRIVEGWMREGGLDLDRRGPEFEQYCGQEIERAVKGSAIKQHVEISSRPVIFAPPKERKEEIDIVIIVDETILLVEAKCILWPDDALQFANYRDTVEKATIQIGRKKDAVKRNIESFLSTLKALGHVAPAKPQIICCVLTNSPVYSGFPINGVPIVDLNILCAFFGNEHVKVEIRQSGALVERHAIQFYADAGNAGSVLEQYLCEPPQLADAKLSVAKREIVFPVTNSAFGQLVHQTFQVAIDVDDMRRRYPTS